jgi:hypothetical protein
MVERVFGKRGRLEKTDRRRDVDSWARLKERLSGNRETGSWKQSAEVAARRNNV